MNYANRFEVRRARWPDRDKISDFVNEAYGDQAIYKGDDRWRWQCIDNFAGDGTAAPPPVWIALDDDKVIGQIGVQEGELYVAGALHRVGWIVDVMILPQYRGFGLGHRLHEQVAAENEILVTLTMAPATRRIVERAGAFTMAPVMKYTRWTRLSADAVQQALALRSKRWPMLHRLTRFACASLGLHHALSFTLNPLLHWRDNALRARQQPLGVEITEVADFGPDVDQLWNQTSDQYPLIFSRSRQFLNWRFVACPQLRYRRFIAKRAGETVGILVLRHSDPVERQVGVIAELYASRRDVATLEALLRYSINFFGNAVISVQGGTSIPEYAALYRALGFYVTETTHPTCVCRDPVMRAQLELQKDECFFSKGDHDWDQITPSNQ